MDEGIGMTMAQPSSVQREPSMEEILASIRRIIEDNETSRKDDKVAPQPASYGTSKEKQDQPRLQDVETCAPHEKPTKDAPIAADPVAEEPAVTQMPTIDYNADASASEPVEPVIHTQAAVAASAQAGTPEPDVSELKNPVLNAVEQQVADIIAVSDDEELTASIVSEQPGRKVAASFSELSDAYQANRQKSLADAMEEMLRPMLREWLDNNLPQLVEKLVREEIERIARGS